MMKAGEKRQAIPDSATRGFSEKGFADAATPEVAKGIGTADSGVYTYFKGKEIFFTIPEDQMRISLSHLDDRIEGSLHPFSY